MSTTPERSLPCPVCEGRSFRALFSLAESSGAQNGLVRCRGCGLGLAARVPQARQLSAFYAVYSYRQNAAWNVSTATEASLARVAALLQGYRVSGRLLDVGCGAGVVLRAMARAGWVVEGTEISSVAAERLRADGFKVHLGSLEDLDLGSRVFDVVVLSEIIEHLLTPRGTLGAARNLLRPGGALYLTTPNFDSLSRRVLGPRWRAVGLPDHLCYFHRGSLLEAFCRTGLRPVWMATEGLNPFELLTALRSHRASPAAHGATEALRELSAGSGPLMPLKGAVNAVLHATRLGDTLKALAIRPPDTP